MVFLAPCKVQTKSHTSSNPMCSGAFLSLAVFITPSVYQYLDPACERIRLLNYDLSDAEACEHITMEAHGEIQTLAQETLIESSA